MASSLRALFRRRSRTLLALAGIGISAALLLDMTMLASGLTESFGELLGAKGYALRVTPKGILPFDSDATIRDAAATARRIASVPGVAGVAPALGAQLYPVTGDSAREPVFATGIDPRGQMLYRVLRGREPGPGEVVVSEPMARDDRLRPGSVVSLASGLDVSLGRPRGTRRYVVSGVAEFLYDYAGEHSVALPLGEVQRAIGRDNQVSLFGVSAAEGVDPGALAARIGRVVPEVSVYSTAELLRETSRRLSYFRQMATILGSVALTVTALLVATIITIGVRERFGEIATLRAIGIARERILLGVVAEGLTLALLGCALGLPLGLWMARRLDRILLSFPGLPSKVTFFTFDPGRVAFALAVVVAVGAVAGCVPGLGAVRSPLGQALREEAE
ncbi:MAG: ABC transporter permease [Gemmatimonadetes bacterium]|nr:ABC transporter permease [Gemmatimonadota bacterium]